MRVNSCFKSWLTTTLVVTIVSRSCLIVADCTTMVATWIALVHPHDLRELGVRMGTISGVLLTDNEYMLNTANVLIRASATT